MDDLQHLSASLAEFVAQPDSPVLLLMVSDTDTLYPLQALHVMDRSDPHTLVLIFGHPCRDGATYMDAVVEQVRIGLRGLARQLDDPPDELPERVVDPRELPADRLLALIEHVRALAGDDVPIVWGLLPTAIGDTDDYRALTEPLMPLRGVAEWMRGHHFVVREPVDGSVWVHRLHEAGVDDALVFRVQADHGRVTDSLVHAAADSNRPDDERMAALMQLAGIDVAHRRLPEALAKYDALQRYYSAAGNASMRALALGGTGDALKLAERPEEALAAYRQGLALAVPAEAFPVALVLLMSAGSVCLELSDWAEAEGYYGLAIDVAAKLLNVVALCDAHEQRGVARSARGEHKAAAEDWIAAKDLARRYAYEARWSSALDRLIETYRLAKLPEKVRALEREKAAGIAAGRERPA